MNLEQLKSKTVWASVLLLVLRLGRGLVRSSVRPAEAQARGSPLVLLLVL